MVKVRVSPLIDAVVTALPEPATVTLPTFLANSVFIVDYRLLILVCN
nr:MAG TPA: hypothetical protein [Caudoviricetes sp.]